MRKKICSITAFMAVLLGVVLIAGCGGQKPVLYTELVSHFSSLRVSAGSSPSAPHTVKIAPVNIKAVWSDINKAVYTAGRYVILDLSSCSVPGNKIDDDVGEVTRSNEYIKGIVLPDRLTGIGEGTFRDCSNLTSVTIPASVTDIGRLAFYGCTSLSAITVKSANTAFSSEAGVLFNKDKTTLVMYPNGKGSSYTIPAKVTSIGAGAFAGCSSLTSVTIPAGVTGIGDGAFNDCDGLTGITIPDSVTGIGEGTFRDCSNLTSVTIPAGVTSIGAAAFAGCSSLAGVTIPVSVTGIGDSAFNDCDGLTSITIPAGVTSIGNGAFNDCDELASVSFETGSSISPDTLGRSSFDGDLRTKYLAEGAGTYTRQWSEWRDGWYWQEGWLWTKQ
jgi:hypothetical protein